MKRFYFAHEFHEFTRIYTNFPVLFINGDLLGRTNFHECTHIISAIYMNVCARREQKLSLLGLCRAAANFRASECRAELVRAMPSRRQTSVENECIISLFFFADFYSQYPLYLRQRLVDLVVEGLALLEVVGKEFGGGKNLFLVFGKLALVEIAIHLQ